MLDPGAEPMRRLPMELRPQALGTYARQKGRWWKVAREDAVVVGVVVGE